MLQRIKRWIRGQRSVPMYHADVVFGAVQWQAESRAVTEKVVNAAVEKREIITTTHLIRELCPTLPLEAAYGVERARDFVRLLDEHIDETSVETPPGFEALVRQEVALSVGSLQYHHDENEEISIAELVGAALAHSQPLRALLEAGDFDLMPLLRWATHNTLTVLNDWPDNDWDDSPDCMYELLLINDFMTTQELVVSLLTAHLGASTQACEAMMLEVHDEGQALLAVGDLELIVGIAESIQADARAAGFPLEVLMRPSS